MSRRADLERAAEQALRLAVVGGSPPDAGLVAKVTGAVRDAWQAGAEETAAAIADAYVLYILNDDDLDGFRDALTGFLPPGYQVPERNPS